MGATEFQLVDRYPYTVIEVISSREVIVQKDEARHDPDKEGGMGHQNWLIKRDPNGPTYCLTLRKDGKWRIKGKGKNQASQIWLLGNREKYRCWEF